MTKIYFLLFLFAILQVNGQERWQNSFDGPLYFTCPSQYSISRIISQHDNHHEDRVWDFECQKTFDSTPDCHWSPHANDFDHSIIFACPNDYVISGMQSYHNNKHEDRRWRFYCCRVNDYCNSYCRWSGYINNFDQAFNWPVPSMNFLVGTLSHHENKHEDRRWQYVYCTRRPC